MIKVFSRLSKGYLTTCCSICHLFIHFSSHLVEDIFFLILIGMGKISNSLLSPCYEWWIIHKNNDHNLLLRAVCVSKQGPPHAYIFQLTCCIEFHVAFLHPCTYKPTDCPCDVKCLALTPRTPHVNWLLHSTNASGRWASGCCHVTVKYIWDFFKRK